MLFEREKDVGRVWVWGGELNGIRGSETLGCFECKPAVGFNGECSTSLFPAELCLECVKEKTGLSALTSFSSVT